MTMTTRTTISTTRRGKFPIASSVLLLCAALLITKSCGILAFSGDGNAELPAKADAWNDITSISEGSGWNIPNEGNDQTENITGEEELTTSPIEEVDTTTDNTEISTDDDTSPSEVETTPSPSEPEQEVTNKPEETQSSNSPSEEKPTTVPSEEKPTTIPSEENPTTIPNEEQPKPTEGETALPTIAPTPPAPVFQCSTLGLFPHISGDCQRFYNCLVDTLTGQLVSYELTCPSLTVFSPTYGRCVRDLATCESDEFVCLIPGRFAGNNDTYYYNCVKNIQGGYHKYIVRCSAGQRFEPLLRRCWRYDWSQVVPGGDALEAFDLASIKSEQKQLKAEEKLRKKAEKNKEKEARKQQKLEEKLAKKAAKEQAKKDAKEQANANKLLSVESVESKQQASIEA